MVGSIYLGLEILAFPCNQFGEEEPGSNDQIMDFVCTRFKSEFPIFDKVRPHTILLWLSPGTLSLLIIIGEFQGFVCVCYVFCNGKETTLNNRDEL